MMHSSDRHDILDKKNHDSNDEGVVVATSVMHVASKAQEWQTLSVHDKIALLKRILTNVIRFEHEWNAVALAARGISNTNNNRTSSCSRSIRSRSKKNMDDDRQGCARADVMTVGPATLGAYLNGLIASLQHCSLDANGIMMPPAPLAVRVVSTDDDDEKQSKLIVTVWPRTWLDKLEAVGLKGELVVVVDNDKNDHAASASNHSTTMNSLQMSLQQQSKMQSCGGERGGNVAGILGAGNVNAPIEVLCEMFLHGRVVVYKPNPVNQAQVNVLCKIFEPLVAPGYLEFVVGDAETGAALVSNRLLDQVVLTGSVATLEKIKPLINTSTTSVCAELGGVNPWIVVPCSSLSSSTASSKLQDDAWNARSIDVHARHLAFAKMTNNGHTCAAPQVVMLARDWPHRQAFMNRVRYWLGAYAGNAPFYPGSDQMYARFATMRNAEIIRAGNKSEIKNDVFEKQQHPILISNVDIDDESQKDVFEIEAFCPVLAEVPIDCNTTTSNPTTEDFSRAFLKAAIQLVEDKCFGSLTANIIIPDQVVKKCIGEHEFDKIIAKMPFGVVGVNVWPALAHSMPNLTWGAAPGHAESGIGYIGNAGLYNNVQKTILRAPFHNWLGIRAVSVMSPRQTECVFTRFATYKLKPNLMRQSMLFAAIFLGI
jgi:acyl-CoA reductase-like NAD-dependent aldehyde dehydrogenase